MDVNEANLILEEWIARTAESYPRHAAALLSEEPDPFRNPVGVALRRSLSLLLRELLGEMNATAIDSALDPIIRFQAVQGFTPEEAVRFVALLRPIFLELGPPQNSLVFDLRILDSNINVARIDQLAATAVDKYAQCREQLVRIRANEVQRASQTQQRIRARRPA
jgi:hypothetical protein